MQDTDATQWAFFPYPVLSFCIAYYSLQLTISLPPHYVCLLFKSSSPSFSPFLYTVVLESLKTHNIFCTNMMM